MTRNCKLRSQHDRFQTFRYEVIRNTATAAAAAAAFVSGILFLSSCYKANVENTYSHRDMDRADIGNRQVYHLAEILCYTTWDLFAILSQSISKGKGQTINSKAFRFALRSRINSDA